jgi:hypothetical protein
MIDWPALLARPADFTDANARWWFFTLAQRLLFGCRLVAHGVPLRIVEVEAYYHGPGHEDPFAHRDPVQLTPGRWYFHRTGGAYRGGSFKGLDVAFGDAVTNAFGGMLIRGVELADGTLIDGPSLTVDCLLKLTGCRTAAELDAAHGERPAWEPGVLQLVASSGSSRGDTTHSLRVGLSLKKRRYTPDDPAFSFLFRSYRYLSEPVRTKKGKPHMVLPGIASEYVPDELNVVTGCPVAAILRYAAEFTAGRTLTSPEPFYGRELSTADLCKLYGLWVNTFGNR